MLFPRWFPLLTMAACTAFAAQQMPKGYFRGTIVGYQGTAARGTLQVADEAGDVYECGYDAQSYLEMWRQRITVAKLEAGDTVRVLADNPPGSTACYVRLVEVGPPPVVLTSRRVPERTRLARRTEQRGDITVSGVVIRADENSLTLRTRDGDETVLLRRDTRYFGDGLDLGRDAVAVNLRVAVRAGRNLDGSLEAYQVSWGSLVTVP
jgi:hypothetical protein